MLPYGSFSSTITTSLPVWAVAVAVLPLEVESERFLGTAVGGPAWTEVSPSLLGGRAACTFRAPTPPANPANRSNVLTLRTRLPINTPLHAPPSQAGCRRDRPVARVSGNLPHSETKLGHAWLAWTLQKGPRAQPWQYQMSRTAPCSLSRTSPPTLPTYAKCSSCASHRAHLASPPIH